jgi:RNA polymerase sigma factor (sigma-70 family)
MRPAEPIEDRHDLAHALHGLPRRMRAVVVLRFVEDLSVRETASCLDIAEGTVKSLTHKALGKLRAALDAPSAAPEQRGS